MNSGRIQIEDGEIREIYEAFGFIYVGADERLAPDEKEDAVTTYPEESGENRDGRTTYAPFDYKVTFIAEAPNHDLKNVNTVIQRFNDAITERQSNSDVYVKKQISFYNDYNRVKIVGTPKLITTPSIVYHSRTHGNLDFVEFDLIIHVSRPELCDFNISKPYEVLTKADTEPNWWHVSRDGKTISYIEDPRLRHIRIRFTGDTIVHVTTKTYGTAEDYIILNNNVVEDYYFDAPHTGIKNLPLYSDNHYTELIVNVETSFLDDFKVIVDRNPKKSKLNDTTD